MHPPVPAAARLATGADHTELRVPRAPDKCHVSPVCLLLPG